MTSVSLIHDGPKQDDEGDVLGEEANVFRVS